MSNAADSAVAFAQAQIGKPYQFGSTGPNSYDCSGLAQASYAAAGIKISRTTFTQIFDGVEVAKADLLPGDLVFPDPGHVQIYVGGGQVVESPHTGSHVQQVAMWGYWRSRRIVAGGGTGGTGVINTSLDTTPVSNPFDQLTGLIDKLNDPVTYERFAWFSAGVAVLLVGIVRVIKG